MDGPMNTLPITQDSRVPPLVSAPMFPTCHDSAPFERWQCLKRTQISCVFGVPSNPKKTWRDSLP